MNIKHLPILVGSIIVMLVSIFLFSQAVIGQSVLISELSSLYSVGAVAGCGLAALWLMGEFAH